MTRTGSRSCWSASLTDVPRPEIVFATGSRMPRADLETAGLITELAKAGVHAQVHPWNGPFPFASVPLVVCRTTWDYLGDSAGFRAWLTAVAGVTTLENPSGLMRWNLHKSYLVELADAGVPVIETRVVPVGATAAQRSAVLAGIWRGGDQAGGVGRGRRSPPWRRR